MTNIIYPPRPKSAIPPTELPYYESLGTYCAQLKFNGSRSVIHIQDGQVEIFGRHGRPHSNYRMPASVKNEFLSLPGLNGDEVWLDAELLNKTVSADTKHKIAIFDILCYGKYLFFSHDQLQRIELLKQVCGYPTNLDPTRGLGYVVSDNILMAETFSHGFKEKFNENHGDEVEGLVLRKNKSVIDNFGKTEYLVNWIVRCRRPHKNYQF